MPIFLVTPLANNAEQLGVAIHTHISPEECYELQAQSGWLVNYRGTSVEISNLIGITTADPEQKPTLGSAMVTTVGSYYGRGSTTMWEWLKTRFESQR
jgi:hypothetical protein